MKRIIVAGLAALAALGVWAAAASGLMLNAGGAAGVGSLAGGFATVRAEHTAEMDACATAYGLLAAFGADPSEANYRKVLDTLPGLFNTVGGQVGTEGGGLADDWREYAPAFLSGEALTEAQANTIVTDILKLAAACEAAGQPAWHV